MSDRIGPLFDSRGYDEGYCDVCGENPVLYPADDPDGFYVCEECEAEMADG